MARGREINLVMIYCPHKGKREATDRWYVTTGECHLAMKQADSKGTRMTQQWRIKDES